jgi:hypothetical protein
MVEVTVDASSAIKGMISAEQALHDATAAAVRATAIFVQVRVQSAMSFAGPKAPIGQLGMRTGRLRAGIIIKMFRQRDGFDGASVQPDKARKHIQRFNEYGTKTGIPARMVFHTVWRQINAAAATLFTGRFTQVFESKSNRQVA